MVGAMTVRSRVWTLAALACAWLPACSEAPGFSYTAKGPAVPLPGALPSPDETLLLPTSKDEVSIALNPRIKLAESVAVDSDERSALAATVVLTLPANRVALRHVDVLLDVKRRPGGETAEKKQASFSRRTQGPELQVALGKLPEGTYDIDVRTVARVDVLDEDWSVMVDTKEATERATVVIGATAGKRESSKVFEFHFANDAATPIARDRANVGATIKAVEALLGAHPEATARVDCWTSISGEEALNMALAEKRCAWFQAEVWSKLARTTTDPLAAVPHSVRDLAAEDRGRDAKVASRNRVARLRVRWVE